MTEQFPDTVWELPPSSRWVYRELDRAGEPLSVTELQHRTGYSLRGIRMATEPLLDEDLIEETFEETDPRRKQFERI